MKLPELVFTELKKNYHFLRLSISKNVKFAIQIYGRQFSLISEKTLKIYPPRLFYLLISDFQVTFLLKLKISISKNLKFPIQMYRRQFSLISEKSMKLYPPKLFYLL